jgi:hypothetical protein
MAKIYGALEVAQLEWFTEAGKPAAASYPYRVIWITDTKRVKVSDGTNWLEMPTLSGDQTFAGTNTFSTSATVTGKLQLSLTANPGTLGANYTQALTTPVTEFTGTITSLSGISSPASGAIAVIVNRTGSAFSVLDEDSGATAANRIRTGTGAFITLANNASLILAYSGDSRWHVIGGTGTSTSTGNYITNGSAEADTTGWATYADTAANIPADGTGGTATGLTFARSTSSPLFGTASFTMTQANATSLQGKGVSYDFTIDSGDKAKILNIAFSYNASSTFVASNGTTAPLNDGTTTTNAGNSDVEVFIYDVTNAVLTPVSPQVIAANGTNNFNFNGTFQTSSNSTSYRLIFHVATTSANATGWTFKFDNVSVSAQRAVQAPAVGDWVPYTLVIGATTTPPTEGAGATKSAYWRRVGDSMEIRFTYSQTAAGTTGTGSYLFPLPTGYSIDTNKIAVSTNLSGATAHDIGSGAYQLGTGNNVSGMGARIHAYDTTRLLMNNHLNSASFQTMGGVSIDLSNNPLYFQFSAKVPIAGWSSNSVMSNDTDTRVVSAIATGTPASVTTGNPFIFTTVKYDSHAAYNSTTGQYTCPVSGIYDVLATSGGNNGPGQIAVYKNGSLYSYIGTISNAAGYIWTAAGSVQVVAGDILTLVAPVNITVPTIGSISFNRRSGPATIAASETVSAKYMIAGAGVTSSTTAPINFATKTWDTHSAVTTGASWKFTAPISGKYRMLAVIAVTSSAPNVAVYKNGTIDSYMGGANAGNYLPQNVEIFLNAGEYIDMRLDSSLTLQSDTKQWVSVNRIGN